MKGKKTKADFGGYVTKYGLKCTDGRTIVHGAFKDQNGQTVPLVWQHLHNEPTNVLGHALLESREDGMYAYGFFNSTPAAQHAKIAVANKDLKSLSIFANELTQRGQDVLHGAIREASLVVAGANPGALIDFLSFAHADGTTDDSDDEAIIYTGLSIEHADTATAEADTETEEDDEETVGEVFETLTDKQKTVVYAMLAEVMSDEGEEEEETDDGAGTNDDSATHSDNPGGTMKKNVFDKTDKSDPAQRKTLTHAQLHTIMEDARRCGSYREAFLAHAVEYGIENIDYLFPDAKTIQDSPDFVSRRMEWVSKVLSGAKHTPFSRIKTMSADITLDDARAKGYVKGSLKKEEFFALAKRVTTPTTIYKKQKLDRDDIVDITDLDVVAWLKAEMRVMLDEELARAALISDNREVEDEDKIDETHIRPIAKDDNFYAHKVTVSANTTGNTLIEEILRNRTYYKGSGNPLFFTTDGVLVDLLLVKDKIGRRLYNTKADLAAALMVADIVPVEAMEGYQNDSNEDLIGVLVNMTDYTFGADKGGQVSMFDDFDIDYNQYKYLIEGRSSGALTKPKSALVFWRATGIEVTPSAPTLSSTNHIAIPTVTGVTYTIDDETVTGTVTITEDVVVEASPNTGYYFPSGVTYTWEFAYEKSE